MSSPLSAEPCTSAPLSCWPVALGIDCHPPTPVQARPMWAGVVFKLRVSAWFRPRKPVPGVSVPYSLWSPVICWEARSSREASAHSESALRLGLAYILFQVGSLPLGSALELRSRGLHFPLGEESMRPCPRAWDGDGGHLCSDTLLCEQ